MLMSLRIAGLCVIKEALGVRESLLITLEVERAMVETLVEVLLCDIAPVLLTFRLGDVLPDLQSLPKAE
jgi:hypothetical protein